MQVFDMLGNELVEGDIVVYEDVVGTVLNLNFGGIGEIEVKTNAGGFYYIDSDECQRITDPRKVFKLRTLPLWKLGLEVFEDQNLVLTWFTRCNPMLDMRRPIDMLDDSDKVQNLLLALLHGVVV